MSLFVDKYRPKTLSNLGFHPEVTEQLKTLVNSCLIEAQRDLPHILFYGPSGSGKKTRIAAILYEIFGGSVEKLKIETKEFTTPSNKKLEIQVISSNFHVEITPSDIGAYDRIVVQDLIKELASTRQLDAQAKHKFKVVVFNEADALSRDAQAALRRTMEKYMGNMRILLCCESMSKIIAPIRSRCLMIRVAAPSNDEIVSILDHVASLESIKLPCELSRTIAQESNGNLRKALLMLEAMRMQQYPFVDNQKVPVPDWELLIKSISHKIFKDQSSKTYQLLTRLLEIRGDFYQLLANCIPASTILKTLLMELLSKADSQLIPDLIKCGAEYVLQI